MALEHFHIPYLIGGSIASSSRGVVRATMDVDLVAQIDSGQAEALCRELGHDWYADPEQIKISIATGRSFNLIHIPTSQKVDIFPARDAFHQSQLKRATREELDFLDEKVEYPIATPEDILLAKLQWYRDGGEISDRQWSDIGGIIATNPELDRGYLNAWAVRLGVITLLDRALKESAG